MSDDPIAELVEALERDGKPSLAWVVRWSEGGRESVAAAWEAATDGGAMLGLLVYALRPLPDDVSLDYSTNDRPVYGASGLIGFARGTLTCVLMHDRRVIARAERHDRWSCIRGQADDVRCAVPVPPTLDELLRSGAG